jgi:hypothetical protein
MDQNPYAPPRSVVVESRPEDAPEAPLFAVSIAKMVVLTIATFGLYELAWLYQHWAAIRRRDHSDIWPVPRAIFGVIFCSDAGDTRTRGACPCAAGAEGRRTCRKMRCALGWSSEPPAIGPA